MSAWELMAGAWEPGAKETDGAFIQMQEDEKSAMVLGDRRILGSKQQFKSEINIMWKQLTPSSST